MTDEKKNTITKIDTTDPDLLLNFIDIGFHSLMLSRIEAKKIYKCVVCKDRKYFMVTVFRKKTSKRVAGVASKIFRCDCDPARAQGCRYAEKPSIKLTARYDIRCSDCGKRCSVDWPQFVKTRGDSIICLQCHDEGVAVNAEDEIYKIISRLPQSYKYKAAAMRMKYHRMENKNGRL